MTDLKNSPLRRVTEYPEHYDPGVLFPVPRADARRDLGLSDWPYHGFDRWNAYELSWLNWKGLPRVAMALFELPASSPCIIESKSLKLYLNSFSMTRLDGGDELVERLIADLSRISGAPVGVTLLPVDAAVFTAPPAAGSPAAGSMLLDEQDIAVDRYELDSGLLRADGSDHRQESLYSHLLRSNCPVTGQPDWGSVFIDYAGPALDRSALLRYICSFRTHQGFHEACVERIFLDILALGDFDSLTVTAKYLRRGGLDINPCRSLHPQRPDMGRLTRQ